MVPINGSGLTRVALLNDFSCFGKCSLTVSIPIISSYGIETVPLPTAVLSTHTGGFDRFVMWDMTDDMRQIAAHWKEMDMQFDCIYTGFFCTIEQIAFAREFIRTFSGPRTLLLSDPVLGDNGSLYSCFSEEFAAEMRKLCEMADIITPNRTEARLLLGGAADDESVSNEALLEGLRNENVIITSVRRGDKIAFISDNELAMTTLFQILMGEMEPDEGSFKWGVTTSQSYFPKDNGKYFDNCEYNLIDWLRQFSQSQYESDIRGWLGRMLFSGEEALKPARVLSGGEKVRCMLARTMLSGANVLILDEPTNHLDLESITALNKGMIEFTGSMLFATQDHECIQTVANRIMEILPGGLVDRRESYDDYIESEIAAQQRAALMQA